MSTVLIVDDEAGIRFTLSKALKGHVDNVLTAADGGAGLLLMRSDAPDVMVLDLKLPDMSGLEVLAEVRRHDPLLPVLIVTAWATVDSAIEALRLGAYDYIRKPFEQLSMMRNAVLRALETRRLRQENLALLDQLERSNQFKAQLFRTVAHDLRNVLLPITVNVEILRREKVQPAARVESMALASRSLELLVADLETYGRISAQALTLAVRPHRLRDSARDAVRLLALDEARHDVRLARTSVNVLADPDRTRQILLNLVGNSVKHNPQGCRIEVRAQRRGDWVHVEVGDDGAGIADTEQPRLFEPFFRGESAQQGGVGGTGLGLAIVRHLVEAHGGTVEYVPAARGAHFMFTLPAAEEAS